MTRRDGRSEGWDKCGAGESVAKKGDMGVPKTQTTEPCTQPTQASLTHPLRLTPLTQAYLEKVGVVAALAQLHDDVEQLGPVGCALQRLNVLLEESGVPLRGAEGRCGLARRKSLRQRASSLGTPGWPCSPLSHTLRCISVIPILRMVSFLGRRLRSTSLFTRRRRKGRRT